MEAESVGHDKGIGRHGEDARLGQAHRGQIIRIGAERPFSGIGIG